LNWVLRLDSAVVGLVGEDLPLVDPAVTVEHLLAHRSGIGDYLDEDTLADINDYIISVPVHQLAGSEDYLVELNGHPQTSPPGARFAYNNGGYVLLALVAERAAGKPFHELVDQHVCQPAGLSATGFVRGDQLDETVAAGYLEAEGLRTNVYHLPVCGSGDGGMVSTTGDIMKFWGALFGGQVVAESTLKKMVAPRSNATDQGLRYGMGFWLAASGPVVQLEGYDAGISFKTAYNPVNKTGYALISNTSDGVWPLAGVLGAAL
jgi:CubicO group peptidase (beta-lactamase class C family)